MLDGTYDSALIISGLGVAQNSTVSVSGNWLNSKGLVPEIVDIESSSGIILSNNTIAWNAFSNTGHTAAIYAHSSSNLTINGNYCEVGATTAFTFFGGCLELDGTTNSAINGNSFYVEGYLPSNPTNLSLINSSTYNAITGNTISGQGNIGISADSTSSNNSYLNLNSIGSSYTTAISDAGTNNQLTGSGGSLTSNTLPKATGAHALSDSLFTDNGTNGAYGGTGTFTVPSLTTGSGSSACGTATGCIAMVEASTAGTPTSGNEYIRANSSNHQLVYSFNGVAESNLVTPLYGTTGTLQASPHIVNGGGSLSGGTLTVTLTGAAVFSASSSYVCSPDDSTAVNGIQVTYTSGSSFTLTGTGTDAVRYTCVGN